MPKAIGQTSSKLTYGKAIFGEYDGKPGSVKEIVYDGDTVNVEADGNLGVRFLGIDTPEKRFTLKTGSVFINTNNDQFKTYLTDPFADDADGYKAKLDQELIDYLNNKLGAECGDNHYFHAEEAHRGLERFIGSDVDKLQPQAAAEQKDPRELYKFFMMFSYEIMDGYGRFLCHIHQDLPPDQRAGRLSYNDQMLEAGLAEPYFIFPNINPFRKKPNILEAVPAPADFEDKVIKDSTLKKARQYVKDARAGEKGIFRKTDKGPLMLSPFELRFLARRSPPSRHVIDLNDTQPKIKKPLKYHEIEFPEDRLFINVEHVPLFQKKGYEIE